MAEKEKEELEPITVNHFTLIGFKRIMKDPHGNRLGFPFGIGTDVSVMNTDNSVRCKISKDDVWQSMNQWIPNDTRRLQLTYNFEAPVGSIPNLCKKQQASAK